MHVDYYKVCMWHVTCIPHSAELYIVLGSCCVTKTPTIYRSTGYVIHHNTQNGAHTHVHATIIIPAPNVMHVSFYTEMHDIIIAS